MTKLTSAFRNSANSSKNQQEVFHTASESNESGVKTGFMLASFIAANSKRVTKLIQDCQVGRVMWTEESARN